MGRHLPPHASAQCQHSICLQGSKARRALPAQVRKSYENALRLDPAHPNALENMRKFFWQDGQLGQDRPPSLPQQTLNAKQSLEAAAGPGHGGKTIQDLPTAPPQDFARASNALALSLSLSFARSRSRSLEGRPA